MSDTLQEQHPMADAVEHAIAPDMAPAVMDLPALVADAAHGFMPVPLEVIDAAAKRMAKAAIAIRPAFADNEPACWAVAYQASRWGMDPIFALSKAYIATSGTKGGVAYEAQLLHALINRFAPIRGGIKFEYGYGGDRATSAGNRFCIASVVDIRTGETKKVTTPTVAQIRVKNSPLWVSDPDIQLGYYAGRSLARLHYPEVLAGAYSVDEMQQIEARTIGERATPIFEEDEPPQDAEFSEPPTGAVEPDDMGELRMWAAGEQTRLMGLEDGKAAHSEWQLLIADKRWTRFRTYDPEAAKKIKDAVAGHIQRQKDAKADSANPATGEV